MSKADMNIVLTGPPGSGKSSVGRLLAATLGREFVDMDNELERSFGCSIAEYWREHGEEAFREAESALCEKLSQMYGLIIASGGGVLTDKSNEQLLKQNGILMNLRVSRDELRRRLTGFQHRPLLAGNSFEEKLNRLLEERQEIYGRVSVQIDNEHKAPEDAVRNIVEVLKRFGID